MDTKPTGLCMQDSALQQQTRFYHMPQGTRHFGTGRPRIELCIKEDTLHMSSDAHGEGKTASYKEPYISCMAMPALVVF